MRKASKDYAQQCKTHSLGPPSPYVFSALLHGLTQESDGECKHNLLKVKEHYDQTSFSHKQDLIRLCKIENCWAKENCRLTLSFDQPEIRSAITEALDFCKTAHREFGAAPAGATEDEMCKLLEALDIKRTSYNALLL